MLGKKIFLLLCISLVLTCAANAALQRVGPVDPLNGGYPAWYQDKTGLTMEFCGPETDPIELAQGWCFILPPGLPTGAVPEVFPTNYSVEHFYWAATAKAVAAAAGRNTTALLVLSIEASFATPIVIPGDQNTFGRIRFKMTNLPLDGTYTVYHPYGGGPGTIWEFPNQVAGGTLRFTEDVGFTCPKGQFDCALATPIGPFLWPSATTGGAELPPIPGPIPGKSYIGDPALFYKVTGSPVGQNYFRVVGPVDPATGVPFEMLVYDFSMIGRVYTGPIPDVISVERASYTQPVAASATNKQLDVFASAFGAMQGRIPASPPPPPPSTPILGYYETDCTVSVDAAGNPVPPYSAPVGFTQIPMVNNGTDYWGQSKPAVLPLAPNPANATNPALLVPACSSTQGCVCVQANASLPGGGVVSTFYETKVTDQVFITQAQYDPVSAASTGVLTILASSSDQVTPTTLSTYGFPGVTTTSPPAGLPMTVPNLLAPPSHVDVGTSNGGAAQLHVKTLIGGAPSPVIPVAVNDAITMVEDCQAENPALLAQLHTPCATPAIVDPVANDTLGGILIKQMVPLPTYSVTITQAPRLGAAVVNLDGTISYTPTLDANGADALAYTITVNGVVSNQAFVNISITPQNDPPVAVNDATTALIGGTNAIQVLSNDSDPDGITGQLADAVIVTGNPSLGIVSGSLALGGLVNFTPTVAGTFTFTYQARDVNGALSVDPLGAPQLGTVTVTVNALETITIAKSIYQVAKGRWVVSGTDNVTSGQVLTVTYNNGILKNGTSAAGTVIGSAAVDALGNWLVDFLGATGVLNPTSTADFSVLPTQVKVTSPLGGVAIGTIQLK